MMMGAVVMDAVVMDADDALRPLAGYVAASPLPPFLGSLAGTVARA